MMSTTNSSQTTCYANAVAQCFQTPDAFQGEITDPQSLHKYAYVHGDPIGGTDPTGKFHALIGSISGILLTVAAGIAAFAVYLPQITTLIKPYPSDAPDWAYRTRFMALYNLAELTYRVGAAYHAAGQIGLASVFTDVSPVGNFTPVGSSPSLAFPDWNTIQPYMMYTKDKFRRLGMDGVHIRSYTGQAGSNNPVVMGISISHGVFWSSTPQTFLSTYYHEGIHDFILGHGANFRRIDERISQLFGWMSNMVDDNGISLFRYAKMDSQFNDADRNIPKPPFSL